MLDFEKMMTMRNLNRITFVRNKGISHLHPYEYIGDIWLINNPGFIIPRINEYISLWYQNEWKLFSVKSVTYNYEMGDIEIIVK
jgi:hypothetical protein